MSWRYLLVVLAAAALTPFASVFAIADVTPQLLLIVALYPTMLHRFRAGYVFAWLAGLAVDLQSIGVGLPFCLLYLLAAYGVSLAGMLVDFRGNRAAQAAAAGAAALVCGNLAAIWLRLGPGAHATPLLVASLAGAIYTTIAAPLVFLLLDQLPLGRRTLAAEGIPIGATAAARQVARHEALAGVAS